MDPISQLSLAANILAVIDLGHKLFTAAAEIHRSATGTTARNTDLQVTAGKLQEATTKLAADNTKGHEALQHISSKCLQVSQKLLDISKSLHATRPGSLYDTAKVMLRAWRRSDEIADLRVTLGECRQQILLEMSILLR